MVSEIVQTEQYSHAENLHLMLDRVLKKSGLAAGQIDAVAVSAGPGSYTGLRIGVSAAKGLCYALQIPLIPVGTLRLMCEDVRVVSSGATLYCPMIDARRNEVYTTVYAATGATILPVQALILDEHPFLPLLEQHTMAFFGDGSDKFRSQLSHPNAQFIEMVVPDAANMAQLAEADFQQKNFKDVAYFEPFYLKAFQAGKPKQQV